MLALRNERVLSFSVEYNDVYWEIETTREDVQNYDFYVDRSEANAGPWQELAGPFIDTYYMRDDHVPRLSATRRLFYRVRVKNRLTAQEEIGTPFSIEGELALDALEIVRVEQVLLREFTGVKTWLYPRRTFGQRCPMCYDRVMNKRVDDSCVSCFGTTFSGGYHFPVQIYAQWDQSEQTEQLTQQAHQQTFMLGMRCGPTPMVKPLDLVIDNQNRRFRVVSVGITSRLGVTVHYECRMLQLARGSIEEKVPLNVDTSTLQARPARVYTNPSTPQLDGNVPADVFRLYRY